MSQTVVDLVRERTGISEEQAKQAVDVVVNFLKEKLPEPIAGQLDMLLKSDVSGVAGMLGGLFGKKE